MYTLQFAAIKQILTSQIDTLKGVDYYNEQYDNTEHEKGKLYPRIYVEFEDEMEWLSGGDGIQTSETEIKLHYVYYDLGESPEPALVAAENLHKAIANKPLKDSNGGHLATGLNRSSSELVTRFKNLKVIILSYTTEFTDCSTVTERMCIDNPITLEVIGELKNLNNQSI